MARTYLGYTTDPDAANLDQYRQLAINVMAEPYGAVGDGAQANAAANVTAIRAALARAATMTGQRTLLIPPGVFVVNDNFTLTSAHSDLTILIQGCVKFANTGNALNVEAGWMWMLKDTVTPIRNLRIVGGELDGSRLTTSWATTSYGVVVYMDSPVIACSVEDVYIHSFRTSGVQMFAGGMRAANLFSNLHGSHGVGVSIDNTFGDEVAEVYNVTAEDNGGYGVDFSKGRSVAANLVCRRNTEGGSKVSTDCEYLQLNGALFEDNTGPGFQNTGAAADLELYLSNITSRGNGDYGFRMTTGRIVQISRLACVGNQQTTVRAADVLLGADASALTRFTVDNIYVEDSPSAGVLVDGLVTDYAISNLTAVGCELQGFRDSTTGSTNGRVTGALLVNNNLAATAGAAGAAYFVEAPGSHVATNVTFNDTQGSPTQVSGFNFTAAVKATLVGCHFGTGITSTGQVYSATAGTRVAFGPGNTGIVVQARGTLTVDGGGTTASVTYPTALTALGGLVLFPLAYPSSADASEANYISSVSATALVLTCPTTFAAGTGNVAFRYDVQAEVQR